jgi:hypothetical protein
MRWDCIGNHCPDNSTAIRCNPVSSTLAVSPWRNDPHSDTNVRRLSNIPCIVRKVHNEVWREVMERWHFKMEVDFRRDLESN